MCLRVDPFDSEGDDIELVLPGGLLDRVANAFSDFNWPSSSSCVTTSASESSSNHHQQFHMGSAKPETFHSIEILMEENNIINPKPIAQEASILVENKVINTTLLKLYYKIMSEKLQVIGEKSERFKDELLITLVGVTGQNAMQMPWSSSASSSGLKYVAMAANCMAFISLLSGVLLRSKGAIEGQARRRVASNMLVMLGILLTAAGPMLNISMNIPGVGRYFVPLVCLLPIIGVYN